MAKFGELLSTLRADFEKVDWSKPRQIAKFLRNQGKYEVTGKWRELETIKSSLDIPNLDGVRIAVEGSYVANGDAQIERISRRVRFTNLYLGMKKTGLRPDKLSAEETLVEKARQINLPSHWYLTGNYLVQTVFGQDAMFEEIVAKSQPPEFLVPYLRLVEISFRAQEIWNWFSGIVPDQGYEKGQVNYWNKEVCAVCWIAALKANNIPLVGPEYKLLPRGEMNWEDTRRLLPYAPFIPFAIRAASEFKDEFSIKQEYRVSITAEERHALLSGMDFLIETLRAQSGEIFPAHLGKLFGKDRVQLLENLHNKLLSCIAQERSSPLKKTARKGSGAKKKTPR